MIEIRALRAAVIGLGAMGAHHARAWGEVAGVELAAVADTDATRVARSTEGRAARGYGDYRLMLEEERIDLLSVAVPTRAHAELAAYVIDRGVPLLVEKPLAASIEEGRRLGELAAARGVLLTAGHVERFNPAVLELKRRIDAGELGRIFQLHARRVGPFPERVRDIGVVLDLAPHDIDVMRFLLGSEVERVQAETQQRIATEHEDMLSATLRFSDGAVGVLDVNWLTPTKIRELSVLGERGMFVVDYLARELTFYENEAHPRDMPEGWAAQHLKGVSEGPSRRIPVEKREPLVAELAAFAEAVRSGGPPPVPAEDAIAAMAVAEALVRAARSGEPVAP